MSLLARFAARARIGVFPATGGGADAALNYLSLDPRIALVSTPRHATILLVSGLIRDDEKDALRRIHDQLPHPRASVWWGAHPLPGFEGSETVPAEADPLPRVVSLYGGLLTGDHASEYDLCADEPPEPWRGRGGHGQGGEGMMGGVPYGRPMAMTAADIRDGLELDAYTARFGPFLPSLLPSGLCVELTLQGDVVQKATIKSAPHADKITGVTAYTLSARARSRASQRLRSAARLLNLLGLTTLAHRCRRAAADGKTTPAALSRLTSAARRAGAFAALPQGLGELGAGNDARARLQSFLGEGNASVVDRRPKGMARLVDLLPGLELGEAFLLINSFEPDQLARMASVEKVRQNGGGEK